MKSYQKALIQIKKNNLSIKNETVSIKKALNRISAFNIYSKVNFPSLNNTAFDGFAIKSSETNNLSKKKSKKFKIIKTIAAGYNPNINNIPKNSSIEVMTGAVIKKPFDTIIPIEQVKFFPNKLRPKYIVLNNRIKKNEFIRPAGSDYKKGDKIISKGQFINSSHILALKTLGVDMIKVKKKPKIVFYPTGDELSNDKKIPNWKVKNSNSSYLKSYLKSLPVTFVEKNIIRDRQINIFKKEINKNIKSNTDLIITSGAVSAGKFDFIPKIIKHFKLKSVFKGVAIRPGKPLMFAKFFNNKCFFGLPGNPISTVSCFRFFVLPLIFKSLGVSYEKPILAKLKNNFSKKRNFTRFIKGRLIFSAKSVPEFQILKGQESYKIKPFTQSNAWGVFKDGISEFKKGQYIECYSSSGLNEFLIN